jgi:hypothetical protein
MKKVEIEKPKEFLELISANKDIYLYNDHPTDGIDLFTDNEIELYGWHGISFDEITYRGIAQFIEENCAGTFTFNDHPMGYNAYAILDNVQEARIQIKEYIVNIIKNTDLSQLNEDQKAAIDFFKIK